MAGSGRDARGTIETITLLRIGKEIILLPLSSYPHSSSISKQHRFMEAIAHTRILRNGLVFHNLWVRTSPQPMQRKELCVTSQWEV